MSDQGDEPSHHARRPMNAFLIFCKRHRSVVREKYPNLENRSITKILGEWWANLDNEEKSSYTSLAKQNKDAFLNANPDFKWYKLPAPPLRTLSSRPTHEKPGDETTEQTNNNNSTKYDYNKPDDLRVPSIFTPGKLADEAHMGGLSDLITNKNERLQLPLSMVYSCPKIASPKTTSVYHNIEFVRSKDASDIKDLQDALSETTKVFHDFEHKERTDTNSYADDFTNQHIINQIVDKRIFTDYIGPNTSLDCLDDKSAGRSCKGKRYQEFMAEGGLLMNKRQKKDERGGEDFPTCSWNMTKQEVKNEIKEETRSENELEISDSVKVCKMPDFDLEAKIKELPSLSLEKFQQKKKENKKKKKNMTFKKQPKRQSEPVHMNHKSNRVDLSSFSYDETKTREMAEEWRKEVIGSQKRKPRKISITRLEVNEGQYSGENFITTPVSYTKVNRAIETDTSCPVPEVGNIDLFALATLAEVASNTSKLEENHMSTSSGVTNYY